MRKRTSVAAVVTQLLSGRSHYQSGFSPVQYFNRKRSRVGREALLKWSEWFLIEMLRDEACLVQSLVFASNNSTSLSRISFSRSICAPNQTLLTIPWLSTNKTVGVPVIL